MAPNNKSSTLLGQKSIQSFFAPKIAKQETKSADKGELSKLNGYPSEVENVKPAVVCPAVGQAVEVFWDGEGEWFRGMVTKLDDSGQQIFVKYDDGDEEWVDLRQEQFRNADDREPTMQPRHVQKQKRMNKREGVLIDSDDEGQVSDEEIAEGSEYEVSSDENPSTADEYQPDVCSGNDEDDAAVEDMELDDDILNSPPKKPKSQSSKKASLSTPNVALNNPVMITPTPAKPVGTIRTPSASSLKNFKSALENTPMSSTHDDSISPLITANRFTSRDATRFPFLDPSKIRDRNQRRPDDPEYDPSTVFIPPEWFRQNNISEGQKQWWEFKSQHFDSVMLFKMGKFYEMFEMDAHIGAECLGLSYMKGEQPHCGFPEKGYADNAERLARAGYRVLTIEQTETPEMLAKRNQERKKRGLKKDTVVRREKVAVTSRATLVDAEMINSASENEYLISVVDDTNNPDDNSIPTCTVGVVAIDVASGRVLLGQFEDDELRSHLRAVLTALKPVEVVIPRGNNLSQISRKVIKAVLREPLTDERAVGSDPDQHFLSAEAFWSYLESGDFFSEVVPKPPTISKIENDKLQYGVLSFALGGAMSSMKRYLLDKRILCTAKFQFLQEILGQLGRTSAGESQAILGPQTMVLDGATLENLEILENGEGGIVGTLFGALDHCVTPFGRRRLREWLCRPLFRISEIQKRQDAVQDLMSVAEEAAGEARKMLAGLADIERSVIRICASGVGVGSIRDSPRVILYEDVSSKKIKSMYSTLLDIQKALLSVKVFKGLALTSLLLKEIITLRNGSVELLEEKLNDLLRCVDWKDAERSGRIEPSAGVDQNYDLAQDKVQLAQQKLQEYLESIRSEVKDGKYLKFASLNKEPYVIEAPNTIEVPRHWESIQGKKGTKRYITEELRQLAASLAKAVEEKEVAQTKILQSIMKRFAKHREIWLGLIDCVAEIDALMSLAKSAACNADIVCRPQFIEWGSNQSTSPEFYAKGLRHPAGICGRNAGGFVPNTVALGGEVPTFTVLTGPNMGGKSTLMRQVCLATVAAQIGAWIPAEEMRLSPVDAIFVRMGAKDHIMLGQSTFFVELSETAAALKRATQHSLVALDELGRGTATTDGSSIASAVLQYLSGTIKCRGIFATHYHNVAEEYVGSTHVALKHMACTVKETDDESGVDDVIFLYQLTEGPCPKSYGANVAKLAGLPHSVVARSVKISKELHSEAENRNTDCESLRQSVLKICRDALTSQTSESYRPELATVCHQIRHSL